MEQRQWIHKSRWEPKKYRTLHIDNATYKLIEILARSKPKAAYLRDHFKLEYQKMMAHTTLEDIDDTEDIDAMIAEIEHGSELLGDLLAAWRIAFPDKRRRTLRDIFDKIKQSPCDVRFAELGNAIAAFDRHSDGDFRECSVRSVAQSLPLKHDRTSIINGLQLRTQTDSRSRTKFYWVEDV